MPHYRDMFLTALAPNLLAVEIARKVAKVDVTWTTWMMGFNFWRMGFIRGTIYVLVLLAIGVPYVLHFVK